MSKHTRLSSIAIALSIIMLSIPLSQSFSVIEERAEISSVDDVTEYIIKAGDVVGYSITVDTDGNSYVTGEFKGLVYFGTIELSCQSEYFPDIFVAKYGPTGNLLWVKKVCAGGGYDGGKGITTDGSSNVIVTGSFSGTAYFDDIELTSANADIFIAKYDIALKVGLMSKRTLRVSKIKEGTVIDHITGGHALDVIKILGITGRKGGTVTVAMNVPSKILKLKDIVKVEGRKLASAEV